jgi:hypothetical protein
MLQTILLGEGPGIALCANSGPASQHRCVQWASHVLQGSSRIVLVVGTYDATARSYQHRDNNTAQLGSRATLLGPRQCDQVPIIVRACISYASIACIVTAVPLQIAILRTSVRCLSMVGGDQDRPMHTGNKDGSTPRLTKLAMPLSPPIALAVGENQHSLLIVFPEHSINCRLPL